MRARISPQVSDAVHKLAIRRGRSDQEMVNYVISLGLASLGGSLPSSTAPDQEAGNDGTCTLTCPLPRPVYSAIRHLARDQGCSGRQMTREVITAGLNALGAWPPPGSNGNGGNV